MTLTPTPHPNNSPGNAYKLNTTTPPMRLPHLTFIWRLECSIAPSEITIGAPHNAGVTRSIVDIIGGRVSGPNNLSGTVLRGGADWATAIEGTHSMTLDARYTVQMSDGEYVYVQAHGLYRPGPGTEYARRVAEDARMPPPEVVTQDDVEFFSHLKLEAGPGEYNWLNGLVAVGVMTCVETRIVIDAYYLTNFEGVRAESVMARREG